MATGSQSEGSLTLVDTSSLFLAGEALAHVTASQKRLSPHYAQLRLTLDHLREEAGWPRAAATMGLAAVDPSNEAQRRFVDALQHAGLEPDPVDYRSTFVSPPPGMAPREVDTRPSPSFVARIAYIAGLMARQKQVALLVVSHAFELHAPLVDLAHRVSGARVGIAYFKGLLDYRWHKVDSANGASKRASVELFDLDAHAAEIFGVTLASKTGGARESAGSFSRY